MRKFCNSSKLNQLLTYSSIRRKPVHNYIWLFYDIEVAYRHNDVLLVCYQLLDSSLTELKRGYYVSFERFVRMVYRLCRSSSVVLCAHNGNHFDHLFFLELFTNLFDSSMYSHNGQKLPILTLYIGRNQLLFRDSYLYFHSSLKDVGRSYNLPKLDCALDDEFDLTTWLPYCMRDVEICVEVMRHVNLLIGSTTFHSLIESFSLADIAYNISVQRICYFMRYTVNEQLRFIYECASYGGRTYSALYGQRMNERISVIDANSMYPSCMTFDYPCGELSIVENKCVVDKFAIYYVELSRDFVSCCDATRAIVPVLMYKGPIKSGLCFVDHGHIVGWYTSVDLNTFQLRGWSIIYRIGLVWSSSCSNLGELYKEWYNDRKLYPKSSPMSDLIKRQMNSSYGKYLQLSASHYDRPSFVGVFLLSYSRAILNSLMMICHDGPLLYTDTDSIFVYSTNDRFITPDMLRDELTVDLLSPRVKIENHHDGLLVVAKKVYCLFNPTVIKSKGYSNLTVEQLIQSCRKPVQVDAKTVRSRFEYVNNKLFCQVNNVEEIKKTLSINISNYLYRCLTCNLYHTKCLLNK